MLSLAFLIPLALGNGVFASEKGPLIEGVQTNRVTLRAGEDVGISFRLNEEAKVTVHIYNPDYEGIRCIADGVTRPPGVNTFFWDGRDEGGVLVPEEAYLFGIAAVNGSGQEVVYDPTQVSGGEILNVEILRIERSDQGYRIHYTVPVPSRISIRAGIHQGPLLKTILDWKPVPPGNHVETWDGMDETGTIQAMEEPGCHITIRGFMLPKNSILVQGTGKEYDGRSQVRRAVLGESSGSKKLISHGRVRKAAVSRADQGISSQFLVRRSLNVSPRFKVYHAGDRSTDLAQKPLTRLSGKMPLVIEVAPESMPNFMESRYEIIVFVDNQRFDEEEHAQTPYTYLLDTTRLSNGEHLITINQASLTDQVGSYSFRIRVNND